MPLTLYGGKLRTLPYWTGIFGWVHATRINRVELLWRYQDLGCESVDGTGWWHTVSGQYQGLCDWVDRNIEGKGPKQMSLLMTS